jgi:UDP-N-acetylmuramyl tripeptide synthase
MALDPDILTDLLLDRELVLVSATNGKTATTSMLSAALAASGRAVVSNDDGSNLAAGLVAALGADLTSTTAVLEVDEAQLVTLLESCRPRMVVLGDLSRDQLDRHHEVRGLTTRWHEAFADRAFDVVATNSDPNVVWAVGDAVWVDLDGVHGSDSPTCPSCGRVLASASGSWSCACGFVRPAAGVRAGSGWVELDGTRHPLSLKVGGRWQYRNAALAVAAARGLGVDTTTALAAIGDIDEVGRRGTARHLRDGRRIDVVLAKNPASWGQVIESVESDSAAVVVGVNDELADGTDPSWLWDVPFERLAGRQVAAAGTRRLDVALRLRHAGLDPVAVEVDPLVAAARLDASGVVLGASYTMFHRLAAQRPRADWW